MKLIRTAIILFLAIGLSLPLNMGCKKNNSDSEKPEIEVISGSTQNTISWKAIDNAYSYNLYWYEKSEDGTALIKTKIEDVKNPYIHKNLKNGNTYYYILKFEDSSEKESEASDEKSGTPQLEGVLDTLFGDDGVLSLAKETNIFMPPSSIGFNSLSEIYLVFGIFADYAATGMIWNVEDDGTINSGFGKGGVLFDGINTNNVYYGIALDQDDYLYVVGLKHSGDERFRIWKMSNAGYVLKEFIFNDSIKATGYDIKIGDDSFIYACGSKLNDLDPDNLNNDITIWKYDLDGNLDNSFGENGVYSYKVDFDQKCTRMLFDKDGNIVVGGYGNDQEESYDSDFAWILKVQKDGKGLVSGFGDQGVIKEKSFVGQMPISMNSDTNNNVYVLTHPDDDLFGSRDIISFNIIKYDLVNGSRVNGFGVNGAYSYNNSSADAAVGLVWSYPDKLFVGLNKNVKMPEDDPSKSTADKLILGLNCNDGSLITLGDFSEGVYNINSGFVIVGASMDRLGRLVVVAMKDIKISTTLNPGSDTLATSGYSVLRIK